MHTRVRTGADPDRREPTHAAALTRRQKKETDTMPAIIVLALIAIVALTVISFTVHFLLSPWLLVAIAILVWFRFRPRHSQR
jgi:Flp pilus assembly protein TadB